MIKVAIIGAGFMGQMHANVYNLLPNAKLVAVVDSDVNRAKVLVKNEDVKVYQSMEDLLANTEVDLIDICTPTYLHHDYVIKAAKAGKHIMCEKPMALNVEEADSMIAAAKEAKVKFMVGHCIRFWPEYQVLKAYADEKKFGEVKNVWLSRLSQTPTWSWNNWLLDEKKSAGALLDLHIHDTDYILYLLGKPSFVFSRGVKSDIGWSHVFTQYGYNDMAVMTEGGWDLPATFPFNMSYRVVFEEGTLDFDSNRTPTLLAYKDGEEPYAPELPKPDVGNVDLGGNVSDLGGYYNELSYYIDCLEKDKYPEIVTPETARDSVALIFAEMRSLESGKVVFI